MSIAGIFFRQQIGPALLVVAFAGFIAPSRTFAQETTNPRKHLTIVGRVVAKVWDLQGLPLLDHSQPKNFTVFVIYVDSKSNGKQSQKFVRVDYDYTSLKDSLPTSFFDYSIRYRFRVVRDARCDGMVMDIQDPEARKLGGLAAEITPAIGAPTDTWDRHRPLECYVLRPGRFVAGK